ncbi:MAG: hemolysin activation/secretion protein [Verrucomicrobiales bacterium]|jgi:hemolysin activation/secretion protein
MTVTFAQDQPFVLPDLSDLGLNEDGSSIKERDDNEPKEQDFADPGFQGRRPLEGFRQSWSTSQSEQPSIRNPEGSSITMIDGGPLKTYLDEFRFEGNTEEVIADAELGEIVKEFTAREITTEDLESARLAVNKRYIDKGYINSGALIPDQSINNGTVTLNIVEGALTDIRMHGNRWLRDGFLERRIRLGDGKPLSIHDLQEPLLLLHRNPNIQRLAAELKPDGKPGESYLQVEVTENMPIRAGIEFSNSRPPSVGEEQIETWFSHTSLTGNSDHLEVRYGLLDHGFDDLEHHGFENFAASYTLPITAHDTTIYAGYQRNSYSVLEEPFQDLDIDGKSSSLRMGIRHPWRGFPQNGEFEHEFALGLYADRQESETSLLGIPFTVNAGAVNGETETTVIRLTQEWTSRSSKQVLALRSTESFGIDAFGTTDDGTERDGTFFSWLGQAQYVRKLGDTDAQMILRGTMQWSNDPLPSLEQFSVGGMNTVRGYRENQLVRDIGYLGTLEFRVPVIPSNNRGSLLTIAPFVDVGGGWNHQLKGGFNQSHDHETVVSAGIGLLIQPTDYIHAELYWGHAFTDFENQDDSLQNNGIHFRISVAKF